MRSLEDVKVRIKCLGCRTNIYEAEAIADSFRNEGAIIANGDEFDVGVLVSCAVTKTAEKKCRQALRRMQRKSPQAITVLCGCYVQGRPDEDLLHLGADLYVGNRLKAELTNIVANMIKGRIKKPLILKTDVLHDERWDSLRLSKVSFHTRSFVKVQDGCDSFCSYCIVPFLRGRPISRDMQEVIDEVERLVSQGCKEVVLTGVHLGLYGSACDFDLGDLVKSLAKIKGLKRLRFGSIEPLALDDKLLRLLAESEIFCRHLHIPLQSGDDGILDLMRRGYKAKDFANIIENVRCYLGDDVHVSTDIIVGFPGESERAFENTLTLIDNLGIGRVHVFPFSPRKGTRAYTMPERLDKGELEVRMDRAINLGRKLLHRFARKWVGQSVEILVEHCDGIRVKGLSRHYLEVEADIDRRPKEPRGCLEGQIVGLERQIYVTKAEHGILHGISSDT